MPWLKAVSSGHFGLKVMSRRVTLKIELLAYGYPTQLVLMTSRKARMKTIGTKQGLQRIGTHRLRAKRRMRTTTTTTKMSNQEARVLQGRCRAVPSEDLGRLHWKTMEKTTQTLLTPERISRRHTDLG